MASSLERVILGYIIRIWCQSNEASYVDWGEDEKAARLTSFQLDGRREPLCLTRM
jgi:hypothetical protein